MRTERVAIVHDWLLGFRGGERVLEAILEIFPDADVFTLFYEPGTLGDKIEKHTIHPSVLNRLPGREKYYRYLLPLLPAAIRSLDLSGYELIISSSHCVAKGVKIPKGARHICYCHTPMRYAWDRFEDYFPGWKGMAVRPVMAALRRWDTWSNRGVQTFLANSNHVAERIRRYYRRDARVIYPFVDLDRFAAREKPNDQGYYLFASAFAPYKRVDLAIAACARLGRELHVVGTGYKPVTGARFLGRVSDEEWKKEMSGARALLFPGEEDFGIVPLEAMASGVPVIALGRGGAVETVVDGETGLLFQTQTVSGLMKAIQEFESREWLPDACRRRAEAFSRARFIGEFRDALGV